MISLYCFQTFIYFSAQIPAFLQNFFLFSLEFFSFSSKFLNSSFVQGTALMTAAMAINTAHIRTNTSPNTSKSVMSDFISTPPYMYPSSFTPRAVMASQSEISPKKFRCLPREQDTVLSLRRGGQRGHDAGPIADESPYHESLVERTRSCAPSRTEPRASCS